MIIWRRVKITSHDAGEIGGSDIFDSILVSGHLFLQNFKQDEQKCVHFISKVPPHLTKFIPVTVEYTAVGDSGR